VARDDKFRDIARRGTALATPGLAHSVRAEATGLEPRALTVTASRPAMRSRQGGRAAAAAGRRTSGCASRSRPASNTSRAISAPIATWREDLRSRGVPRRLHLRIIVGRNHVRKHTGGEPRTLDEYRAAMRCIRAIPTCSACTRPHPGS
jgi:alkaline phosphatase D